jgi:Domain of unknown function (DUF5658)
MNSVSARPRSKSLIFGLPASTLAMVLLFLAALDSFATIAVMRRHVGIELNPIMRWLLQQGYSEFLLTKLLLTALCARWIMRRELHPYARVAALIGLALYVPVVGLHIFNNYAYFFAR